MKADQHACVWEREGEGGGWGVGSKCRQVTGGPRALQGLPIKAQSSVSRGQQLLRLAAVVVGVEAKATLIHVFQQHHAHRGPAIGSG